MKRALFITIGTRDVSIEKSEFKEKVDAKQIKQAFRKNAAGTEQLLARPAGELILNNLSTFKKSLKFPIIEPFIRYLSAGEKLNFEEVFLVATDQDINLVKDYSLTDTVFLAEILKKVLPGMYKSGNTSGFEKIEILKVRENVVYLDNMFSFFNNLLRGKRYEHLSIFDEIHILNQGGIDAINYGLLLNALYLFGEKTHLYNVNERSSLCTPLDFGTQFGYEQEKARVLQAISRFDYSYGKLTSISKDVATWASYAEARLNFDFDSAYLRLSQLSTSLREKQVQELLDIERVRRNAQNLSEELFWNAMIRYRQEAYVDFVQRFFRLVEQYAQTKALSYLKDFDYDPKEFYKWEEKFKAYLEIPENSHLKEFLINYKLETGQPLKIENPNIPVFMSIIDFFNKKELEFLRKIEPLSKIRNKGIGAHGFEPVSLKQILEKLNVSQIEFEKLLERTGKKLKVTKNPFDRINENIKLLLSQP